MTINTTAIVSHYLDISVSSMISIALGFYLLLWRLWNFTVLPFLLPHRPKTLPYWIPWLGHTLHFVLNADRTLERGRLYFGDTRKPFAIVLGGQTVYVVTSARDVTSTFRNVEDLAFNDFVKGLLIRSGASSQGVDTIFDKPAQNSGYLKSHFHVDWRGKPLSYFCERIIRIQLMSKDQSQTLGNAVLSHVLSRLDFDAIPQSLVVERTQCEMTVSLHAWARHTILEAMTKTMYGESFLNIDSSFLDTFHQFDTESWKLTFKIPAIFARRMFVEREKLLRTFIQYFEMPADQRSDACWMIKTLEAEMRAEGHTARDISTYLLLLYWVINANAWKAAFWMASRVLHDSHLRSAIEKEVNPLCATTSPTTCPELFQKKLERCPILTATYYETLRTVTSSISAREVVSECTIGSLRFQADTRVIIPSRQTLIDDSIFGANAKSFDINRFLKNPRLIKSPSFRPFGGGISYCPGRFMAMKEAMSFTVLVLRNFDVKPLDAKLEYPRIDTAKPCLGIMDVVHDEDLLLRVRRKII